MNWKFAIGCWCIGFILGMNDISMFKTPPMFWGHYIPLIIMWDILTSVTKTQE